MNESIAEVKAFMEERHWDKVKISNLAKSISIESAELLELFQWTEMDAEQVQADPERLDNLKKELADILIYSYQIMYQLDLDPVDIVHQKLQIAAKKYPVDLVKDWESAEQAGLKAYEERKKQMRSQLP